MSGSLLRGPSRRGAHVLDEGASTTAVVARYAKEDGSRGQEAAEKVSQARQRLFSTLLRHSPRILSKALKERCHDGDATGRNGILELRRVVAEALDPPPRCGTCNRPMSSGKRDFCPGSPWDDPAFMFPWDVQETQARKKRCRPSRAKPTLGICFTWSKEFKDAREACKSPGDWEVLVDRDGRALLAASDPLKTTHPEIQEIRSRFDAILEDGVVANGRLILRAQLKFYSPDGSVSRSDLVQGGALGCRRALMDYDSSKAKFATYALPWIRQAMGECFGVRDLVATPEEIQIRRRKVTSLGIDPVHLYSTLFSIATARSCGPLASLDLLEGLLSQLEPLLEGQDREVVLSSLVACLCAGTHRQKVERTLERLAGWVSGHLDKKGGRKSTGAGLLSALRHGAPVVVSVSHERPEDDDEPQAPSFLASEELGSEAMLEQEEEEQEEEKKQKQFLAALDRVRHELPEAAEVLRRHHGLDGLEPETLEEIASSPLRSTGRRLARESIRLLGERALSKIKAYLVVGGDGSDEALAGTAIAPLVRKKARPTRTRPTPHWNKFSRPWPRDQVPTSSPPSEPVSISSEEFSSWSSAMDSASQSF